MGVVSVDKLVLLDMGSMVPKRVVAGFPGMVPVDTGTFARKAVDIRRYLVDSEWKRFLLDWFDPFGRWTLPL